MALEIRSENQQVKDSPAPNPVAKAVETVNKVGDTVNKAGEAIGKAVKSAYDTVDRAVGSLQEKLKSVDRRAGEKLIDEGLKDIKAADEALVYSIGIGATMVAAARSVATRIAFQKKVKESATGVLRHARDHGVAVMAKPNDRETEKVLKYMLDTVHGELDKRKEKVIPVPVPVPFIPIPFDVPPGFFGE